MAYELRDGLNRIRSYIINLFYGPDIKKAIGNVAKTIEGLREEEKLIRLTREDIPEGEALEKRALDLRQQAIKIMEGLQTHLR